MITLLCVAPLWLPGTRHPPCIVLDELDGAAGGGEAHNAVAAVVKLVTGVEGELDALLH